MNNITYQSAWVYTFPCTNSKKNPRNLIKIEEAIKCKG